MQYRQRVRPAWTTRLLVAVVAVTSVFGLSAVVSPAQASVYSTCTISRCPDARTANTAWKAKGYPTTRGWVTWTGGQCSYAGGQYYNYEAELPSGRTYYEYDVYPRTCGAARDAYRIIVDKGLGKVWFSPNHYTDFYLL
ncbi:ribonuclease domain-containing protein [Actinomadura sp. DC4]|uniref:ribonuclease domain-containing protein n=1 Tax=Actinomadura sp. DC4 TaxID=3055069 RepID=UPI0025B2179B|nr:ribonuclease domain-containing protein [Actinomadura sp. DC4]MDN3354446.1 ribonuclease domain-containing protein [Actinomadura sp. DC4]